MDKLLLKPAEVTEILGIGRSRIYQMLACGALPSVRIGRSIRIPSSALREWVKECQAVPQDRCSNE